ncbi:MAG: tetratricopeptide repeat protein [Chitinophagales bacterium]|nr:tetratricopeptide repeat protein [Chitinophagaceae bacterium]MCB9064979.1 tetratricopeptide repeat protein [Chitinophagales bacterium]
MLRLLSFIILLQFTTLYANAQIDIAGKPFPEKWQAVDSIIKNRPKGSKKVTELLNPLIEYSVSQNDEELELLLKITQLKHKLWERSITDAEFTTGIRLITIKAQNKGLKHIEAMAHHTYSVYWSESRNLAEAVKYGVKSYNLYHDYDPSYFIFKKYYTVELAKRYDAFEDVENSLKYRYEAMQIPPEDGYSSDIFNVLGLIHTQLGNYDSALYYFNKLHDIARDNGVVVWQIISRGNSVDVYIKQKQYDTALKIVMQLVPLSEKHTGAGVQANLLSTVASIQMKLGHLQIAESYYEQALDRYRQAGVHWYYENLYPAMSIYRSAMRVKAENGKYKAAYGYADTVVLLTDSINKKYNVSQLKAVEKELGETKLDNANQLLAIEKKNALLQRNLLISVVVIGTIIILFISFWYNKRKERLETTKNKAQYDLQASQDKLASFTNSIQEKNKLLVNLEEKLTTYETNEKTIDLADTISKLHETTILSDHDWVYFKAIFEKAHPGYLISLKEKYPDLTQAEIRYIVLAKLDMSTKEMATILGVNSSSIRSTKSRILKKLALQSDEELKNLINTI